MDKVFKKSLRAKQLDRQFALLDYYAKCEEREMEEFRYWCEERRRYAERQDYLNSRNRDDFEM